jgi:transcriptional regulator with XRE-family HTH domain
MAAMTKPFMNREKMALEWRLALADYIREARRLKGMTQAELATAIGVNNFQFISGIENGRTSIPPERQRILADVLGIDRAEFAKVVMRYSNPWMYADVYGEDAKLRAELRVAPERLNKRRGPPNI